MKGICGFFFNANTSNKQIGELEHLLTSLQVFYADLDVLKDNINQSSLYPSKEKYANLHNDTADKIHELLQRIISLGGMPALNANYELNDSKLKKQLLTKVEKMLLN